MTFMVGLIVFMDNCRQFGFPLLKRDAFRQFVFINCTKSTTRRGFVLSLWIVNLLFFNVFCRIIFCHFSILFSAAKIYNYLNCSILFLVKKINASAPSPPPKTTLDRCLSDLKRQRLIEYRGSKKTGGYCVVGDSMESMAEETAQGQATDREEEPEVNESL